MSRDGLPEFPQPVSSEVFRRACGRFATGIAIAGAIDSTGAPHGLTVSSFAAVSLDPPLILISLGHALAAIEVFRHAKAFGLSILRENQRAISERFSAPCDDRFEGIPWLPGHTGVPLLTNVLATMECVTQNRVTAGDHDIFIAEMVSAQAEDGGAGAEGGEGPLPLIHFTGDYRRLSII